MDLRRLRAGEWICGLSGVALLVSLWLPWYAVASEQAAAGWTAYGPLGAATTLTAWQSLAVLDLLLALLGVAAVAVALVTASSRGEAMPLALTSLTTLVALVAVPLALLRVADPPDGAGAREWGLWLGVAGALGVLGGGAAAMRDERRRPPASQVPAMPPPRPEATA